MDASLGESPDGGTTELVVVPELDSVGLPRPHSVPLVKIVTAATQDQLNDVIDASPTRLGDVIDASPTQLGDVINSPTDVTIADVALGDEGGSAMVDGVTISIYFFLFPVLVIGIIFFCACDYTFSGGSIVKRMNGLIITYNPILR